MAKREILGLEIEVDSAEVDKTDKKLRSLDKLLQQTQRRAAVLGKTKIAPKITLDDRFTSAAEKVKRTLIQIQRTKVRPVVHLVDNVSAAAARIRASLLGVTATPWRVSLEGVDWEGIVKKPLIELLEDATAFAEAGKKAGESYFQSLLSVIDPLKLTEKLGGAAEGGTGKDASSTNKDKGQKSEEKGNWMGDFATDFTRDLIKDLSIEFIKEAGVFDKLLKKEGSQKDGACVCICKCNCGGGSGGLLGDDYGSGSDDDGKKKRKKKKKGKKRRNNSGAFKGTSNDDPTKSSNRSKAEQGGKPKSSGKGPGKGPGKGLGKGLGSARSNAALGFRGNSGLGSLFNTGSNFLKENGPALLNSGKKILGNGASVKDSGSKLLNKGGEWLSKGVSWAKEDGSKLLKKSGGWFGKGARMLGKAGKIIPGPVGTVFDVGSIATAGSKRDKAKATASTALSIAGGAVGGVIGSVIPGAGTAIGATLGSIAGDFIGDKLGGFFFDKFSKKKKAKKSPADTLNAPESNKRFRGLQDRSAYSNKSEQREFKTGRGSESCCNCNGQGTGVPPQINVSVSQGAVNLTVNKDELDYEEIGKVTARKITNEIRLAMQNIG